MAEKRKLLIADDDSRLHKMFGDFFSGDYEVLHAYDGAETLMLTVEHLPDVVLLDIMMPLLDGRTICKKLKENPKTGGVTQVLAALSDRLDKLVDVTINYPEGVRAAVGLICTNEFSATQIWQPTGGDLQVGDGITRKVTRTVSGTPAMALAPFQTGEVAGVRIYPKQPGVADEFNRGDLTGTRVDQFTYVFQQAGTFKLPEARLSWWDLQQKDLRTELLAGLEVVVQPAEPASSAASSAITSQRTPASGAPLSRPFAKAQSAPPNRASRQ